MGVAVKRRAIVIAVQVCLALTVATPAGAFVGAGVDIGRIDLSEPAKAGNTYRLTDITVVNTGDEPATFVMEAKSINGKKLGAERSWFVFEPSSFRLYPKMPRVVRITMTVPADAKPGAYQTILAARPDLKVTGAGVGVAAGARLKMNVVQSNPAELTYFSTKRWFVSNSPWSYAVPIAIIGLLVFLALWRRGDDDASPDDAAASDKENPA